MGNGPSTGGHRPLVVAHRGGAGLAPENTLAACSVALALGADAIEVDVRLSADGQAVALHDATLERTTTGHGPVGAMTAAALRQLDAGRGWAAGKRLEVYPPTLAEVLECVAGRAAVWVELKGDPAVPDGLVAAVEAAIRGAPAATVAAFRGDPAVEAGIRGAPAAVVTVLWFDWAALGRLHAGLAGVALGPLAAAWPVDAGATLRRLRAGGVTWLGVRHAALTPARLAAAHAAGLRVNAWTVNGERSMQRVAALGVDAITTDWPDRLWGVLACGERSP